MIDVKLLLVLLVVGGLIGGEVIVYRFGYKRGYNAAIEYVLKLFGESKDDDDSAISKAGRHIALSRYQ